MRIMQRAAFAGLALAGSSVLAMSPAAAQDIPNLVGTWKGETQAVHIGPNPYRIPEHNGPNFPDNFIEFTYVVKEQHGTRFAGETVGKFTETFIGMLKLPDFRAARRRRRSVRLHAHDEKTSTCATGTNIRPARSWPLTLTKQP
jgi:hypothetical protein